MSVMELILAIVAATTTSSGLWAYLMQRDTKESASTRILMGLAYDKITFLGMKYIERGWISKDEYEDFKKFLYDPYKESGGNGVAEKIMAEVSNLPFRSQNKMAEIERAKRAGKENMYE